MFVNLQLTVCQTILLLWSIGLLALIDTFIWTITARRDTLLFTFGNSPLASDPIPLLGPTNKIATYVSRSALFYFEISDNFKKINL